MYFSASNSLSVNGTPILNNFYESNAPTQQELKTVEANMALQDLLMETLTHPSNHLNPNGAKLVADTTGLGATLDIII